MYTDHNHIQCIIILNITTAISLINDYDIYRKQSDDSDCETLDKVTWHGCLNEGDTGRIGSIGKSSGSGNGEQSTVCATNLLLTHYQLNRSLRKHIGYYFICFFVKSGEHRIVNADVTILICVRGCNNPVVTGMTMENLNLCWQKLSCIFF